MPRARVLLQGWCRFPANRFTMRGLCVFVLFTKLRLSAGLINYKSREERFALKLYSFEALHLGGTRSRRCDWYSDSGTKRTYGTFCLCGEIAPLTACSLPKLRKASNLVCVTMLQASPPAIHFKRVLNSGEGQPLEIFAIGLKRELVEPMGFEPTTSSMPSRRAPNCATAPPEELPKFIIACGKQSRRTSPRMTTSTIGALRSGPARVRPFARLHH